MVSVAPIDQIARFLASPSASGILIGLGFAGILIEMQTLLGVGLALAFLAFAIFFGSHVAIGTVAVGFAALAAAGLIGIAFEFHVGPGHGFAGVFGAVAIAVGLVVAIGPMGALFAAQTVVVAIVLAALVFRSSQRAFPRNAFAQRLVFTGMQGTDYVAGPDRRGLLGRAGVAASTLRPAGIVSFDGERIDAFTEGDFVGAGAPVHVTRVEGGRVFVAADPVSIA